MDIGTPRETATAEGASPAQDDVLQASSRKRGRIREMLEQSRKKRQQLNDTIDIHKQLREVTSGLAPGQRVYVRYEYDDLIEIEDGASQPQIIDAKMVWWPAQLAVYSPVAHLNQPSQAIVSAENSVSATSQPAPAAAPADTEAKPVEESRQYTAEEVFSELKNELTEEDRRCMVELMKTHAHKIVYTLDYEGREAFSPESIPCFFIDQDNLMHLHKCWGAAVYRTESNIGEVNLEEPLEDGIDAVANLFVGGGEEELGSLNEVAEKVVAMLTSFYRHADQVGSRTMTAADVCDYFVQRPEMTIVLTRLNDRVDPITDEVDDEEDLDDIDARSSEVEIQDDSPSAAAGASTAAIPAMGPCETSALANNADGDCVGSPVPRLQDNPFPRR